jgi:16S rRNA (adenine1518-N6/adenine1519-N6)-dimethyltransferase
MVDSGVLERAARYADINSGDTVLEIGPGLGFLTKELAKRAGKVNCIEYDKKLQRVLSEELKEFSNIDIAYGDACKVDFPKFNKVVSNIPYSISAPLTFKLLDYDFDCAVLMYQKEFGEKMLSEPCTSEYGRLSVMAQYYFDVEMMEVIPKTCFFPQPKVDSVLMKLVKKKVERDEGFDVFIREVFRYKNKNISNAAKMAFGAEIDDIRKVDMLEIDELKEIYDKYLKGKIKV